MYECWIYKDEPHMRLVVKSGAMLPTELGHKDWTLMGPWQASEATAHEVDHRGFHFFRSEEAVDSSVFKNAAASGN